VLARRIAIQCRHLLPRLSVESLGSDTGIVKRRLGLGSRLGDHALGLCPCLGDQLRGARLIQRRVRFDHGIRITSRLVYSSVSQLAFK
jgi:hypothetical protein